MKKKAMFVSLSRTFPQLADTRTLRQGSDALRNCTCVAWKVSLTGGAGVEYLFGVYQGHVVSAYRVDHPVQAWPVIPAGALGSGRRIVPVVDVSEDEWGAVDTWDPPAFFGGSVRYAQVVVDTSGRLVAMGEADAVLHDEEVSDAHPATEN